MSAELVEKLRELQDGWPSAVPLMSVLTARVVCGKPRIRFE